MIITVSAPNARAVAKSIAIFFDRLETMGRPLEYVGSVQVDRGLGYGDEAWSPRKGKSKGPKTSIICCPIGLRRLIEPWEKETGRCRARGTAERLRSGPPSAMTSGPLPPQLVARLEPVKTSSRTTIRAHVFVAWPRAPHNTIAGLLRLRAFRRSGPISLLAAWACHEADHP